MIQCRNFRAFGRDDRNTDIVAVFTRTDRSNNQLIVEYGLILFNIAVTRFVVGFGLNGITVRVGLIDRVEDIRGRVGNNVISYCLFTVFISVIVVIIDRQAYQFWFVGDIDRRLCELVFALTGIKPEQILFDMLIEILTSGIEAFICIFLNNLFDDGLSRCIVILKVEVFVDIRNVITAISVEHIDNNFSWGTLINIIVTVLRTFLFGALIHIRNRRTEQRVGTLFTVEIHLRMIADNCIAWVDVEEFRVFDTGNGGRAARKSIAVDVIGLLNIRVVPVHDFHTLRVYVTITRSSVFPWTREIAKEVIVCENILISNTAYWPAANCRFITIEINIYRLSVKSRRSGDRNRRLVQSSDFSDIALSRIGRSVIPRGIGKQKFIFD